jgi:predicted regulator of Ras-like GTPase activity (Roadblock/LC7/MglB family)/lipopolysaccharide biosynthesis regulator YciM
MHTTAQLEERISKCEEILSQNPESLVFAALSDAYRKKGDLGKAFHACSQGLKVNPNYGAGHLVMARINLERGMYTEAEKELAWAEQADGRTRATELLMAQILINKGQVKEARRLLEKVRSTDPDNQVVTELLQSIEEETKAGRPGWDVMTVDDRLHISKVIDLKDGVHYLKSLPGVQGASIVDADGVVVESKLNPNLSPELVGAVAARITACVEPGISRIGFGQYQDVWVGTVGLELWIHAFAERHLVLCYSPEANVGALRLRVNELLEHLSANLQ